MKVLENNPRKKGVKLNPFENMEDGDKAEAVVEEEEGGGGGDGREGGTRKNCLNKGERRNDGIKRQVPLLSSA